MVYSKKVWTLIVFHSLAVLIHLSLSITMATSSFFGGLRNRRPVPLLVSGWTTNPNATTSNSTAAGQEFLLTPCLKESGLDLNTYALTEVFNSTTTLFHVLYLVLCLLGTPFYLERALREGVFLLRWLEYGISATAMILLIYVQVGARNVFTFVHAAALTILVMFTGGFLPQYLFAPRKISQDKTTPEVRPLRNQDQIKGKRWRNTRKSSRRKGVFWLHIVSWALFVQSYAPVFFITASSLGDAQESEDNDAPVALVRTIVAVEFLFFASFGVVESVKAWVDRPLADQSHEERRGQLYFRTELAYVALSVTSKSILIFLTASSLSQMPEFSPASTCSDL